MSDVQVPPELLDAIEEQGDARTEEQRKDEARSKEALSLLEEIRDAAHEDTEAWGTAFESARHNLKFVAGEQWDERARQQRENEGRPILQFSKLNQFIDRVYGAMCQRQPSVKVLPQDGHARKQRMETESKKRIKGAAAFSGMIRAIEQQNGAVLTYLDAYETALGMGYGGSWRYRIDYTGWSLDPEVLIEPIADPLSVVWDAASTRITNEDARRCMITTRMPLATFRREYPGNATVDFPVENQSHMNEWKLGEDVLVAEWFVKRPRTYLLTELSDGRVVRWTKTLEQIRDELEAMGVTVVRERQHKGHVVTWYKVAGMDVLAGPVELPGDHIPVVTAYGRRLWIDGKYKFRSLIEHAKDEQKAYNYTRTRAIEKAALAPLTPFIIGESQLPEGHEKTWGAANTKSLAYLTYRDNTNPNRPAREYGATDLGGLRELVQMAEQGMQSAIGQYEASLGERSNEKSGRAVLARAQQADMITQPFVENFHAALTQGARILMDYIPVIYTPGRVAQILNEDGSPDAITMGAQAVQDQQTGETVVVNDVSFGRYNVAAETAPSFTTRRQEAAQSLTEFGQTFGPNVAAAIAPDVLRNSDFPGADRMARRAEALLPPAVRAAGDDEEENPLPPQAQAVVQQAKAAMQQAEQMVEQVKAEAEAIIVERDQLKQRLEAEKLAAATAQDRAKVEYDKRILALERAMFGLEQKIAAAQSANNDGDAETGAAA